MKFLLPPADYLKLQLHRKPWKENRHVFCTSQFLPEFASHHLSQELIYLKTALPMKFCMPL